MKICKIVTILALSINLFANESALSYLNSLRAKTGLNALVLNTQLSNAAKNHASYLIANPSDVDHYEHLSSGNFYTGFAPSDRAVSAGYKTTNVRENLSTGNSDANESIDGLFSAIYHRFGFLAFDINEVGIGIDTDSYVYEMGNSHLNTLCGGVSFSGYGTYYTGICADETFKIAEGDYNTSHTTIVANNPSVVLFPPQNGTDIPPVFYEESPDPLPNYSVSGYPVSISFNNYFVTSANLIKFELYDVNNTLITDVLLMNKLNDPNNKFSELDFALFPLKRLEWGSIYRVKAEFSINSQPSQKYEWSFKTREISQPLYKITQNAQIIHIKPETTYAIYLEPTHANDDLGGYSASYPSNWSFKKLELLDQDTLLIDANGSLDQNSTLTFSNGRTLTLVISNSDSAIYSDVNSTFPIDENSTLPSDENVTQEDNSTTTHTLTLVNGWNLLGAQSDMNVTDIGSDEGNISLIWTYKSGKWSAYSPDSLLQNLINQKPEYGVIETIKKGEGFWVLSK